MIEDCERVWREKDSIHTIRENSRVTQNEVIKRRRHISTATDSRNKVYCCISIVVVVHETSVNRLSHTRG